MMLELFFTLKRKNGEKAFVFMNFMIRTYQTFEVYIKRNVPMDVYFSDL